VRHDLPSRAPAATTGIDRSTVQTNPSVEELTDAHDRKSDHSDRAREARKPSFPEAVSQRRDEQASEIRPDLVVDPSLVRGERTKVAHRIVDEALGIGLGQPANGPPEDESDRREQPADCTQANRHLTRVGPWSRYELTRGGPHEDRHRDQQPRGLSG
jgi:hypothetical protein